VSAPASVAQVTALTAGARSWTFTYEALDNQHRVTRSLAVAACTVANNSLADKVKRTCKVTVSDTTPFNQMTERFRAYANLRLADGTLATWCMGTFLLSTNVDRVAEPPNERVTAFEGYDLLQVLVEDKVTTRYVVAAGTAYTTAVATVLTAAGFTAQITASAAVLPAPMEWEVGAPRLTIVNDLLTAINYETLTMTPLGVPTSQPYLDPGSAPVIWQYTVDAASVIRPGIDRTLDLFDAPNTWVGVVSQPDRPPLVSTVINSDSASPTSTVSRERSIVRVLADEVKDAADQATLDALVARYAADASQVQEEASFTTLLMPFHENADVFTLDDGTGRGPVVFREHTWEAELVAGGAMKHTMRRVVTL
jgi:hypothetical protein